jgi:transposase
MSSTVRSPFPQAPTEEQENRSPIAKFSCSQLRRALDAGLARAEAARTRGFTDWTIRRWQQRRRETGTVAATPRPGRRRYIGLQAEAVLREQVRTYPDATLAEPCAHWAAVQGVAVSAATMSRALRRLGLPLKKSP